MYNNYNYEKFYDYILQLLIRVPTCDLQLLITNHDLRHKTYHLIRRQSTTTTTYTKKVTSITSTTPKDLVKDSLENLFGFWSWQENSELENVPNLESNNPWQGSGSTSPVIPSTTTAATSSLSDLSWSWTDFLDEPQEIDTNQIEAWSWSDDL